MKIVLLNVGLAGLFGFFLSIYFFVYRLNIKNPWRWLFGIFGGILIGSIMAFIDFFIIWPPSNIVITIIGISIMILITALLLFVKPRSNHLIKVK